MRKLATPKKVTLPNGKTFYAKQERVKKSLTPDATLRIRYRRRQHGMPMNLSIFML